MAIRKLWLQNVILNLFLLFINIKCSKLNVPRVLLPVFNDFSAKFTLEATEGGCYKWSTTRNDIIQITALDEDIDLQCSSKVVITAITKEAARNIAVVLAEDVHTKQTLRCDVIVDVINSLLISTTTRELFMEEAPENFEVQAYDDQGNEFSSLEGIEFEWNIVPLSPNKDVVLRYITFRDSPYETPPAISALENEGKKGYSILLEGVKSGAAKVTVRLPWPEYKHIEANEVQLMVVANLLITPPDVYVMPGDVVPYKIFYLNNGRMEEIELPDSQYYLEAENSDIASSFKKSGNVTALAEGHTRIVLRDRNVGDNDTILKLPAANLHVVQPEYVVLNVLPYKNWAILLGDHHDIVAEVYSSSDHKLYIGSSVQMYMDVSPEFHVASRTANGSWMSGFGIKSTVAVVQASLEEVYHEKTGKITFPKPITARGDLMIYPRITIAPSEVILPWDPITRPKYDIDLVAKGGDGRFLWTSSDHSIGVVSQTGHVRTYSNGFFEVSAVMLRNHHNRQSAKFIILPPSRLEIVEFVMESEVGQPVYLHIALYAEQERDGTTIQLPFTKCQDLPFQIKQSDTKFRQNKSSILAPVGISCGNIAMTALEVGTSKVTVTYFQDGRALEDSVTVSAYNTLKLLEPNRDIVLAVGTTINLLYVGGPRPFISRPGDHQKVVVSEDTNIVTAADVSQFYTLPGEDFSVVQVLCHQLGETDVKLIITNSPSASNCKSQSSSVTTRVTCGKPRKLVLQPELKIADANACPMDLSSGNVVVQSTKNIDLSVVIYDDCGNKFLNISSLNFVWTVTPSSGADFLSKNGVFPKNITIGSAPIALKSYQSLHPNIEVGNLEVNVTVTGYKLNILKAYDITPESPPFKTEEDGKIELAPIAASLDLYLVNNTVIAPNMVTLFNHPGNKQIVTVKQGSGYFELALSSDDIATVKYIESCKEIEIIPIRSGELTVQVIDLCLVSKPATLVINVVSVGIIRVEMADKVEIGKCISSVVRLYDENDNLMVIPDPNMIDLRPQFQNSIANIIRAEMDPAKPWGIGEIHYVITGIEVGDTKLVFTVSGGDEDINSAPFDLQVFYPLKIHPRNGTILVGAIFQLSIKGGPQPNTNVVFTATSPKIINITERGVITGVALGTTKIQAKAVGIHPSTGQSLIYSEDVVDLKVVELQGLKIMGPLTRFRVGATVPFWCWGIPDVSPLILGSLENPPILFKWNVDDKLLVDLSGVFHPIGVFKQRPARVALKVFALQPGKTRLYINATVPGRAANKLNVDTVMLSSYIDIETITEFSLVAPEFPGRSLLMAPFSEIQLQTNLDYSATKIVYMLAGDRVPSTELLADKSVTSSDTIITISPTGFLKSYGVLGHALIMAIETDDQGQKQRLSIVVEVKTIQYMNLNVLANWRIHSDSPMRNIPLGTEFQLRATFHDNLGNKFQAGPKELKVRPSRCDLLKVVESSDNASVWIYTKKPGNTMLKGWAEGIQKTADYVKINVEQAVRPQLDHLTSGDIVCLWTPVVSEFNTPGTWKSSDSSLMMINPALDIGFVGNREGVVVLTHTFLQSAPIHIQIYPVSEIEFLDDPNMILTNGEKKSIVRVVLVLQSEKSIGLKTNNLIQGWRCRTDVRKLVSPTGFKCFVEFSNESSPININQFFNVTNSWVPETGQYACELTNLGLHNSEIAVLQTNVTLWATTEDYETISKRLNIKFLPNFFVLPEVTLAENSNTGELFVVGLPEVLQQIKVQPADSSILFVGKGKQVNETAIHYDVQLIDYHWRLASLEDAMGIIVSSLITKQKDKVLVKVTGDIDKHLCGLSRSPVFRFLQHYKYAIAMAGAMLFIFLITFYFYSNYMQPIVNVNVHPTRSMLTSGIAGSPTTNRCAANMSANLSRVSSNISPNSNRICNRFNCNCTAHSSREPIYGDASTFYTSSPELRRNRRIM
ncbi:nuclear pore membrane glycoprotein 210 [Anoplophora glabripennis]|nr:nuclear pore membrane glycoprotein 210 [Anoplophora glabripennis]